MNDKNDDVMTDESSWPEDSVTVGGDGPGATWSCCARASAAPVPCIVP